VATILVGSLLSLWQSRVIETKVPTIGRVITVGVDAYWEETLENKITYIDWGVIYIGSSSNITFYLESISNVGVVLNLTSVNWVPEGISEHIDLTWNYDGNLIDPGEVIKVTLTLSTTPSRSTVDYLIQNEVNEFSFDLVIRPT
jgi:hypothetical protein